jgi:Xaa-Pro dipeptidase
MTSTRDLWFEPAEFAARLACVQRALADRDLDGLIALDPESITWTTGFFTPAFGYFSLAAIPRQGEPILLCRDVSAYYVRTTCAYSAARYWSDGDDKAAVAAATVCEALGGGRRIGIELDSWRLNVRLYDALRAALAPAELVDVGTLLSGMRLVKSPAEIAYQRRAGRAAEVGMEAGLAAAVPGATERDVAAAVGGAMVKAGSDTTEPGVLSSGERARHLHGTYTDRVLEPGDTLQLECCPHVRHYNARFMRTIKVGRTSQEDHHLAETMIAVQDRALTTVGPGISAAVPDRIYREGILGAGVVDRYTNKTFYSVGLLMEPHGGEWLEATPDCTWLFEVGQTFHSYLLAGGFGFSETITITPDGYERLTNFRRELLVSGG